MTNTESSFELQLSQKDQARDFGGDEGSMSISPSKPPIDKSVLGLLMFIGTEVMFFGGLISTFLILRAGSPVWPPLDQPRLPVGITGLSTLLLLLSGFTMNRALNSMREDRAKEMVKWLFPTAILGAIFLFVQGFEWVGLLNYGLTFTSSVYGATFYALIGCHALHVLAAMIC